jgi:hypothetical protein
MHYASHFTRHASEEEFTRDLREAQNEMQGGSRAVGSANDAVRDTRDALVKRGQMLQVWRDAWCLRRIAQTVYGILWVVTPGQNAADRSQRLQDAAQVASRDVFWHLRCDVIPQNFSQRAAELRKKQVNRKLYNTRVRSITTLGPFNPFHLHHHQHNNHRHYNQYQRHITIPLQEKNSSWLGF